MSSVARIGSHPVVTLTPQAARTSALGRHCDTLAQAPNLDVEFDDRCGCSGSRDGRTVLRALCEKEAFGGRDQGTACRVNEPPGEGTYSDGEGFGCGARPRMRKKIDKWRSGRVMRHVVGSITVAQGSCTALPRSVPCSLPTPCDRDGRAHARRSEARPRARTPDVRSCRDRVHCLHATGRRKTSHAASES